MKQVTSPTFFYFFLPALFISSVAAAPPSMGTKSLISHEKRSVSSAWMRTEPLSPEFILPLKIGLAHSNEDKIPILLDSVSHPDSPRFGQHYTVHELAAILGASTEAINSVKSWLTDSGITKERHMLSPSKSWMYVNVTVQETEKLLGTKYYMYEHPSGSQAIGCDEYSIPSSLKSHIDLIVPTVHMNTVFRKPVSSRLARRAHGADLKLPKAITGVVSGILSGLESGLGSSLGSALGSLITEGLVDASKAAKVAFGTIKPKVSSHHIDLAQPLPGCDQALIINCIQALYNFNYTQQVPQNNSYAVAEFGLEVVNTTDLQLFFGQFVPSLIGTYPINVSIDGGILANDTGDLFTDPGESDLDLQYAMGLTAPLPVTLLQVGDAPNGDDISFNDWLDGVDGSYCAFEGGDDPELDPQYPDTQPGGFDGQSCGIAKPPNVISISYGFDEFDITPSYALRQCSEYAKLGSQGVTILYSSGDSGAAGQSGFCLDSSGNPSPNGTIFSNTFPGGCPYITSVGATQVDSGKSTSDPESVWAQSFDGSFASSGGGFSNIFPVPKYQAVAVNNYLTEFAPAEKNFNTSGSRGYPDLAANGNNYLVFLNGQLTPVSGTSASSPTVGAMIASINDARIAQGKNPIGFLNNLIYSAKYQAAFNDITNGTSQGCSNALDGFSASPGWDPVTGLGTPKFDILMSRLLAEP